MTTCPATIDLIKENDIRLLLLGFPKCGTTAFAEWLSTSSRVDVSSPKETFLLCPEFADNLEGSGHGDWTLGDCFAGNAEMLRMEATTLNVYSLSLLEAAAQSSDLKCIILTRDPVQTALSWHNQVVNAGFHVSDDFTKSWNAGLENGSTEGKEFLRRYKEVSSHGAWTERWLDILGHERCLLVRSDVLKQHPDRVRVRVEKFLGHDLDVPETPPIRNSYAEPRSRFVYDTIRGSGFLAAFRSLERHMQFLATARRFIRDSVVMRPAKKEIPNDVATMLRGEFADDQELLAGLESENHSVWP